MLAQQETLPLKTSRGILRNMNAIHPPVKTVDLLANNL